MLSRQTYSLTLGRAVGLVRSEAEVSDQKAVLRALVALARMGPIHFSATEEMLSADGVPIPDTLVYAHDLSDAIRSVGARDIRIQQHAAPADLLFLIRALAGRNPKILENLPSVQVDWDQGSTAELPVQDNVGQAEHQEMESVEEAPPRRHLRLVEDSEDPAETRTAEMPVTDGTVDDLATQPGEAIGDVQVDEDETEIDQSAATVAFQSLSVGTEGESEAAHQSVDRQAPESTVESAEDMEAATPETPPPMEHEEDAATHPETVREMPAMSAPTVMEPAAGERRVSFAMLQLVNSEASELDEELSRVELAIKSAIADGELEDALDGVSGLVNLEREVVSSERPTYAAALERVLTPDVLRALVSLSAEGELEQQRLREIVRRAGPAGVHAVLELISSRLPPEASVPYVKMLMDQPDGANTVTSMIGDLPEDRVTDVVRAIVSTGIEGAATLIGTVAITSTRYASRAAAIRALPTLGSSAEGYMSSILQHGEPADRRALLAAVGPGAGDSVVGLIEALLRSDGGDSYRIEALNALGRIGSPRAITYLIKASLPGGRFFGRRNAVERVPAIKALGLASGPAVIGTLEELAHDKDREIREAARQTLQSDKSSAS